MINQETINWRKHSSLKVKKFSLYLSTEMTRSFQPFKLYTGAVVEIEFCFRTVKLC